MEVGRYRRADRVAAQKSSESEPASGCAALEQGSPPFQLNSSIGETRRVPTDTSACSRDFKFYPCLLPSSCGEDWGECKNAAVVAWKMDLDTNVGFCGTAIGVIEMSHRQRHRV